ncbi:MAG: hypothetical protein RLZZ86_212 [Cyanobacteriota bacterium]
MKGKIPKANTPKVDNPRPENISNRPKMELLPDIASENLGLSIPGTGKKMPRRTRIKIPTVTSSLPLSPAACAICIKVS